MGNYYIHMNQMSSTECSLKRTSNESYERNTNKLSVRERDYMIRTAIEKLRIGSPYHQAVKRSANYLTGDKFWTIFEFAQKSKNPAHYFIRAVNREMYK